MDYESRLREMAIKIGDRLAELRSRMAALEGDGGGASGPVAWADIAGKPAMFPPEAHAHAEATPLAAGFMAADDKGKLDGIAAGATANASNSELRDRSTHTGSQSLDTTSDSATRLALTAPERTKLAGIASGATANDTDANLRNRANHTGSQAISTVTGLQAALDGLQPADADLSAIAALTTTAFGRSLLTQADAAALRALLGLVIGTNVQAFDQQLADLAALSYAGNAFKVVRVNAAANGLELATISGGGQPLPAVYRLTANHSNSTVTPTTITDGTTPWTHTLGAGKTYRFTVWATHQTAALTTGGRMNLLGAGGLAGTVAGMMWGAIVQAAAASTLESPIYSFSNGAGSFLLTTAVNPINAPHIWGADFVFHCSAGGTLSLQWASEVAASAAQLNTGSVLTVQELN